MKVQFLGAARTVTGSCYMIEANGSRFAVDCGMHQGNVDVEKRNYNSRLYDPSRIDFFLITHAHIDHTGLLPRMVRDGFSGPVYCTEPTRDLLGIMLQDSAGIQEMEAEWQTRKRSRKGKKPVEPLYTQADAARVGRFFEVVEYNQSFEPAPGISVTYKDAGHILGSAFLEVTVCENGRCSRLVFSGDLGRPDALIVRDPEDASQAEYLFVESTYGDRNHKDESNSRQELAEAIAHSYEHGEKVIIPAFAVERTQEVLYTLFLLWKEGRLPVDMPIFLDSPLAIRATSIFRNYPKFFDQDLQKILLSGEDPLDMPSLRLTVKTHESQAINNRKGPAVIISASGMCNAGRIKHHLRHNLWRLGASIVFVGYQGAGTPGRRIVDGAQSIRIFGEDIVVRARVFTIGGFSGHAGQRQILDWVQKFARPEMKIFLVHGEEQAQQTLKGLLEKQSAASVYIPGYLEEVDLELGQVMVTAQASTQAPYAVQWDALFAEAEACLARLKAQKAAIEACDWTHQSEIRDKLLELNGNVTDILSEL